MKKPFAYITAVWKGGEFTVIDQAAVYCRKVYEAGLLIKALTELKKEREEKKRLELENAVKAQQIAEMQPKVSYYDIVLACPDLVTITQIAKDFGMSAKKLNKILKEKKIQFKQGRTWFLYQKYAEQGYTQSKTYLY